VTIYVEHTRPTLLRSNSPITAAICRDLEALGRERLGDDLPTIEAIAAEALAAVRATYGTAVNKCAATTQEALARLRAAGIAARPVRGEACWQMSASALDAVNYVRSTGPTGWHYWTAVETAEGEVFLDPMAATLRQTLAAMPAWRWSGLPLWTPPPALIWSLPLGMSERRLWRAGQAREGGCWRYRAEQGGASPSSPQPA
jgi:hypothetical protein